GPNLLVASVLEPDARTRDVYLPEGSAWCDFHTGQWYVGGQAVTLDAPLERAPLLARASSLIPLAGEGGPDAENQRMVCAFPHPNGGQGAFTLVEDDGETMAYQRGAQARVTLRLDAAPDHVRVAVDAPQGGYPLPYDAVVFVLPQGEARPVHGGEALADAQGRRRVRVPVSHP
ncbi:MAG: DUF5110 domain-containing protein, partial [Anaerolineae bacterium]|nr:DUF5110 domain-containing protein [Anaerolineae bacterium]